MVGHAAADDAAAHDHNRGPVGQSLNHRTPPSIVVGPHRSGSRLDQSAPGTQPVPASGTLAIADSTAQNCCGPPHSMTSFGAEAFLTSRDGLLGFQSADGAPGGWWFVVRLVEMGIWSGSGNWSGLRRFGGVAMCRTGIYMGHVQN